MTKYRDNQDVLDACKSVVRSFCKTIESIIELPQKDISIDDHIDDIKNHHKEEIESVKSKLNIVLESITGQMHVLNNSVCSMDDNIANKVTSSVSNVAFQSVIERIDTLTTKSKTGKERGTEAEAMLFEMLSRRLLARDGYTITMVSGISRSCDIMIERTGYPTIRIESKAYGKYENVKTPKVPTVDVEKFKRDLHHTNNHGIMVSLHGGITGIGKTEIQQLSNGKFAVYLSNNEYDIDMIVDMLHVLYKIDDVIQHSGLTDGIILRNDDIQRVQAYIVDFTNKIESVKNNITATIRLLSGIQLTMIERIVLGNSDSTTDISELPGTELKCNKCDKPFKSKQGHAGHIQRCRGKNKDE
jgi:hypothetical protein